MSASVAQSGIIGEEELLPCGCSPLGSRGRKRCNVALALNAEVNSLQERVMKAPAGPERMAVMSEKARVYDRYRVHLGARTVSNPSGLRSVS